MNIYIYPYDYLIGGYYILQDRVRLTRGVEVSFLWGLISNSIEACQPPADLDDLAASDLRTLVLQLFAEVSALKQVVAEQRAEIARLKSLKGPPSIKPSGMEQTTSGKPGSGGVKRRGRGGKKLRSEMKIGSRRPQR
jgi:hypothetical protein